MSTKFQLFKQKIVNNYIMTREIKDVVVERNHKVLIKVSLSLFFLSVLSLFPLLMSLESNDAGKRDYILHYASLATVELITLLVEILCKNIKKFRTSNLLLIFNYAALEFCCYYIFTIGVNPFNSLIIFVCLATLVPLIYAIEPLYYSIIMIVIGFLMGPRFIELYGTNSATNGFVYIIIMSVLALSRWFYIKNTVDYEYKTQERERQIQKELEMAALVQKSFYQHDLASVTNWNIAYYNDPMLGVSGDLFDFFVRQNKLSGLCIFDVSGHGLASGLVTMMVKNTMEEEFYENEDVELDFTMKRINERVRTEKGSIENYLTGIILRFTNDNIEMVNAGHPIPIIYDSKSKNCEFYDCDIKDIQGAIGLGDLNFDFTTKIVDLKKKDRIILFTDGVIEAKNVRNEEFGKERFLESVQKHCELDVKSLIDAVVEDVNQYIGTATRTDDISIVVIEKK